MIVLEEETYYIYNIDSVEVQSTRHCFERHDDLGGHIRLTLAV